jgi:hypothetical protein
MYATVRQRRPKKERAEARHLSLSEGYFNAILEGADISSAARDLRTVREEP